MRIIFLGTKGRGIAGQGKHRRFIDVARPILEGAGNEVLALSDSDALPDLDPGTPTVACLIYNEETCPENEVEDLQNACAAHFQDLRLIHPVSLARIVRNKRLTLERLKDFGIPVPALITDDNRTKDVFSIEEVSSGGPTSISRAGDTLDRSRLNVELIDAKFGYGGEQYLVSLRATAFWGTHTSTHLRCRNVREGSASVHGYDTPLDASLINHLYSEIVIPRRVQIIKLCESLGEALGPGFYAHDLLPSAQDETIYVCETGFKFDEVAYPTHLKPIRESINMTDLFDDAESRLRAYAFNRSLGALPLFLRPTAVEGRV